MTVSVSFFDIAFFVMGIFVGYMLPRVRRYYGYRRSYRSRRRYY